MRCKRFFLIVFVWLSVVGRIDAQGLPGGGGSERQEKNLTFVPIPYIDYNRSLGFTAGFLPMGMYNVSKKDTVSPSSISGGLAMYTTNDTWFLMLFNKWYLKEDKYRVMAAGGAGNVNYQFFWENPISPGYIDYSTEMVFAKAEVQRKVYKNLYLGLNYTYVKMITKLDFPNVEDQTDYLHGIGTVLSYDTRDDVYYPRKGDITNLNYVSFPGFLGNEFISNKITLDYSRFFSIKKGRDIIATRFYGGMGIGDLQFNQQFVVNNVDIRGYTQGKYRGEQMLAIQGEYRWNFHKKLGLVGFAGLATVFTALNEEHNGVILPGVGTGFRYLIIPKNHMNVGMDVAVGKDDWGLYFRIGEAF